MRYIQTLVTRTPQTDKIPLSLMLEAINHTLGSNYGIEFESQLPTYLSDCNYQDFKTSSFHKRFNPCRNCLIINLEKTLSRTFRYTNKSDVRVKDPITESETIFLFFPPEVPKVEINSTDAIKRGFIGEDFEGRALPKELIAEFKKDDEDWDDFYSEDDSDWNSYNFVSDYSVSGYFQYNQESQNPFLSFDAQANNGQPEKEALKDSPSETPSDSETSKDQNTQDISLATKECDFQILQQIKSKKYILEVDQRITITQVANIDMDKVPMKENYGDLLLWRQNLQAFIRCGWSRINILRNSGDGDKELLIIANQLKLLSEAYGKLLSLKEQTLDPEQQTTQSYILPRIDNSNQLENELLPVIKKMVVCGKDKEAMLIAKNWLPVLKVLMHSDSVKEETEMEGELGEEAKGEQFEISQKLLGEVLAVLGVLEFRRRQDGWAAQHLLESIKMAFQDQEEGGDKLDIYNYLSNPSLKPSTTPWLLKDAERLRMSELLGERAHEYLNRKEKWVLYEYIVKYLKDNTPLLDQKEQKRSVTLLTNLSKKMLKESKSLIDEDKNYYVPKVVQLQYDLALYYSSKDKMEEMDEYLYQARDMIDSYSDLIPLNLKADLIYLTIDLVKKDGIRPFEDVDELIEARKILYQQNQNLDTLDKVVDALLERIELNRDYLKDLYYKEEKEEDWDEDEDEEEDWDEDEDEDEEEGGEEEDTLNLDGWTLFGKAEDDSSEDDEEDDEDEDEEDTEDEDEEDTEDEDEEDTEDEDEDYGSEKKVLKEEIEKDYLDIQAIIEDFKTLSMESEEDIENPTAERQLQVIEVMVDSDRVSYLTSEKEEGYEQKSFEIYQSLIGRLSQLLAQKYDKNLYKLYCTIVRDSSVVCFKLQKYNELKKGYRHLIAYQKNRIANMPPKGKEFSLANLELATSYCFLGAFYNNLQTFDHALKYAQLAQTLVDKYADVRIKEERLLKIEVYFFLYMVGEDAGLKEIADMAIKEVSKIKK